MKTSYDRATLATVIALILFVSTFVSCTPPKGKAYSSPESAVDDFIGAVRNDDTREMVQIFGNDSKRLFQSEDEVADKNLRQEFLRLYDEKHELQADGETRRVLVVGPDSWPMPIPLVKSVAGWTFDTKAGLEEIINRRVGRNELSAIQTCLAIGDAEREYYRGDHDGDSVFEYAQTFRSDSGKKNGLYWPASDGEPQSPIGELVATAQGEGYKKEDTSYHGYRYKILKSQGPAAPGGGYDYMVNDNQIGGFAVVAFPAAYDETGVMTFIMSHEGIVYQKDLGEQTEAEVQKLTSFNPDGWQKVDEKDLEPLPEGG